MILKCSDIGIVRIHMS
ncbi:hypothetical protein F383_34717 [Gossypium arboreum]|uniref:Uncharacterized protein n=1 Tax=Gossypium arboreum TaxID=29729 RepID=A0A0B0PQP9_GOSAR|nr:hypothetical protein F383_34717 [Gossypium arboreum]